MSDDASLFYFLPLYYASQRFPGKEAALFRLRQVGLVIIIGVIVFGMLPRVLLETVFAQESDTETIVDDVLGEIPAFPARLSDIISDAEEDAEALERIVVYFDENQDALAAFFETADRDETAASYAMYIVHMTTPYGEIEGWPPTFAYFANEQQFSHGGVSLHFQMQIARALNLHWRWVQWENGGHVWMEVLIDGQWEIFDATANQRIDHSIFELLQGVSRSSRQYLQTSDLTACEACQIHFEQGYSLPELSWEMSTAGIEFQPYSPPVIIEESIPT